MWPRNTKLALAAAAAMWAKRASVRIIKKANRWSEASLGAIRHSIIDHKFVTVKEDYSFLYYTLFTIALFLILILIFFFY